MCCNTCVLNLPALRSQETFPRLSVLTNEQCEYTQYLYKGSVVAKKMQQVNHGNYYFTAA